MSKYFRPWNIDQTLLLPPNVQDFVPKGHVSRFIVELVRESLDLQEITGSYVSGLGQPPFDPRMMVALLLHGYASGLYSSRRIAKACRERNDFVMIVALDPPDFRTISDFRKRHLKALGALFLQGWSNSAFGKAILPGRGRCNRLSRMPMARNRRVTTRP